MNLRPWSGGHTRVNYLLADRKVRRSDQHCLLSSSCSNLRFYPTLIRTKQPCKRSSKQVYMQKIREGILCT